MNELRADMIKLSFDMTNIDYNSFVLITEEKYIKPIAMAGLPIMILDKKFYTPAEVIGFCQMYL